MPVLGKKNCTLSGLTMVEMQIGAMKQNTAKIGLYLILLP